MMHLLVEHGKDSPHNLFVSPFFLVLAFPDMSPVCLKNKQNPVVYKVRCHCSSQASCIHIHPTCESKRPTAGNFSEHDPIISDRL